MKTFTQFFTLLLPTLFIATALAQVERTPKFITPPKQATAITYDGGKEGDKDKKAATATVAVPDTARNYTDMRAKPKVEPGSNPNAPTIIGEKFCDVAISSNEMDIKNLTIGNKLVSFSLNIQKQLSAVGLQTTNGIRARAFGKSTSGFRSITLVFDNSMISYIITNKNNLEIVPITVKTPDNNLIIPENIVVFGINVAAISCSGIITTDGISETYSNIFGYTQPNLIDAKLEIDSNNNITIRASNIRTKDDKKGKYRIYADGRATIEEDISGIVSLKK